MSIESFDFKFTIFTPTFNRSHCLERLFNSLNQQSYRNFEWLILDDGSTDNTKELVQGLIDKNTFSISYYYHNNIHKFHTTLKAVSLAKGEFFYTVDSDDELVPNALEVLNDTWESINYKDRELFSGVTGLCVNQFGENVGDGFPLSPLDSNINETIFKYKVKGEKSGFQRTSVMRQFLFLADEFQLNRGLILEGILWTSIANKGFKTRYINEILRVYYVEQSDSLTTSNNIQVNNYGVYKYTLLLLNSFKLYYLNNFKLLLGTLIKYIISGRYEGYSYYKLFIDLKMYVLKFLFFPTIPLAKVFKKRF